jgi:asparagine synthase (glutamine-hydrolysing)
MCGIAGIANTEPGARPDAETIRLMCNTLIHRGPDDEGLYVRGEVGLGIRRLSIVDIACGHQPIHNEDETVWVVFNGEIYNFPELRRELQSRGHSLYTQSDTEVIVHLYEELGSDCVHKLRGMFAIALWDERRRTLLLARDRLGKKPLHYALYKGNLYFGSEIKSLLAVAPQLAEINSRALLEYLNFGYIPDPNTAFTGIYKLPPGHLLEFEKGKIRVRQYWDLPPYDTYFPKTEEDCLEELERRLFEATRIRLISEVPLGAFLSGGVDSSTVVAMMARASSRPVKTFSIGFTKDDFNEAHYARVVASKFGTDHHDIILEPDVIQTVGHLTASLEEPFGDSSMLPTYYVAQMARQHVTVALSGDGGDEIFGGYDRYRIHVDRRIFENIPDWARRLYRNQVFPRLPVGLKARKFSYNVSLPWGERYIDGLSFLPSCERDMTLLSPGFRDVLGSDVEAGGALRRHFDDGPAKDPVSQLLYVDTKTYLAGDILTKVDRMSMLNSLEVRAPILDHELVEWAAGLSSAWKLRGRQQKYILLKLAERIGVPREALYRRKQGFALPLKHWMRHELKDILMVLIEPRTLQRGYFEPAAMHKLMNDHWNTRRDLSDSLWRLLMFELWHRNFLEQYISSPGIHSFREVLDIRGKMPSTPISASAPARE